MTTIFYFSGTGNSLSIAKGIASRLGETELVPIGYQDPPAVRAGIRVGIVSPVYFMDLPEIVARFAGKLELSASNKTFGVVNMGLLKGNALHRLRGILLSRGAQSFAGYSIRMPDNSIIFPTKDAEISALIAAEAGEVQRVADGVESGGKGERLGWSPLDAAFGGGTKAYANGVLGFKRISSDSKCVGCGACARACPVGNIQMEGGKPVWMDACASCFACVHRCPSRSVGYRSLNRGKFAQYVHPELAGSR